MHINERNYKSMQNIQIDFAFFKYMQSLKENYKCMHTHGRNYISMKNMTNVCLMSFEIIKYVHIIRSMLAKIRYIFVKILISYKRHLAQ